ncbi:MAG: 30S ribosomal protein S12 methylthiotransferase RimO [Desulforhopalus sp.]
MAYFHLISLGCAKNLVDSEVILGSMANGGWEFTDNPHEADLLLLNTCGFIQPAVEEAVEEIMELVKLKEEHPAKLVVVVGCLVQRYKEKLVAELPEVDLFLGTEVAPRVAECVAELIQEGAGERLVLHDRFLMTAATPRVLSTPGSRAWLKITEGCDNRCSYCMIPAIRGGLRSREIDDLVAEAKLLQDFGVRELSLIAQDTTAYGNDRGVDVNLVGLMDALLEETSIPWFRLLYLYPTSISDLLLQLISANPRFVPYLDIPIQHVNDEVLYAMNRHYTREQLLTAIQRIRNVIPDIALRTTFLVGFPGESEAQFLEIGEFMTQVRFDHVGVFPYTNEEGAPSEKFPGQLPEEEKFRRRDHLLALQASISADILQKYVGRTESVLVEGLSSETDLLLEGRTRFQAPEVDGCVYINDGVANPGDIVQVKITDAQVYDLVGEIVY